MGNQRSFSFHRRLVCEGLVVSATNTVPAQLLLTPTREEAEALRKDGFQHREVLFGDQVLGAIEKALETGSFSNRDIAVEVDNARQTVMIQLWVTPNVKIARELPLEAVMTCLRDIPDVSRVRRVDLRLLSDKDGSFARDLETFLRHGLPKAETRIVENPQRTEPAAEAPRAEAPRTEAVQPSAPKHNTRSARRRKQRERATQNGQNEASKPATPAAPVVKAETAPAAPRSTTYAPKMGDKVPGLADLRAQLPSAPPPSSKDDAEEIADKLVGAMGLTTRAKAFKEGRCGNSKGSPGPGIVARKLAQESSSN